MSANEARQDGRDYGGDLRAMSECAIKLGHRERSYIRINVEIGILEHGSRKQHHLYEYEKIFEVVRDFLCYELHEVRH